MELIESMSQPVVLDRKVTLRFAATAEHLVLARLAITGIAMADNLSERVVSDLKLAVTEACTNAIEHAYVGRVAGGAAAGDAPSVYVSYTLRPEAVEVEVADRGIGFDPKTGKRATIRTDARIGGMGLSIIKSLVDELTIVSDAEGSRIAFVKRRDA